MASIQSPSEKIEQLTAQVDALIKSVAQLKNSATQCHTFNMLPNARFTQWNANNTAEAIPKFWQRYITGEYIGTRQKHFTIEMDKPTIMTLKPLHPYSHGFVGPYDLAINAPDVLPNINEATESNPYWYTPKNGPHDHHSGPRLPRLGWGLSPSEFNLLEIKISGPAIFAALYANPKICLIADTTTKIRVKCWVKVIKGVFGFSHDVGCHEAPVTAEDSQKAQDGWVKVDTEISCSATGLNCLSMGRSHHNDQDLHAIVALPYFQAINAAFVDSI